MAKKPISIDELKRQLRTYRRQLEHEEKRSKRLEEQLEKTQRVLHQVCKELGILYVLGEDTALIPELVKSRLKRYREIERSRLGEIKKDHFQAETKLQTEIAILKGQVQILQKTLRLLFFMGEKNDR